MLAAMLVVAPVLPATAAAPAAQAVEIRAFAFAPKEITVAAGTTITWTNRDAAPHALAAVDHSFASTGMDTGDSYRHTFDHPGDVAYVCTLHPFMTGVVHVRDDAARAPDPPPR